MDPLRSLKPASRLQTLGSGWRYEALVGTLSELSAHGASATLTLAMRLVWEAQSQGEPVAWVSCRQAGFYPPDAWENGVDLDALAIARVPDATGLGKAADLLVRSGAFGLVVIDLEEERLPERQLTRLLGLAREHGAAVVCLTVKPPSAPSLGSVVALRGEVALERRQPGEFACTLRAIKDKRQAPGWAHLEVCRAPAGLR